MELTVDSLDTIFIMFIQVESASDSPGNKLQWIAAQSMDGVILNDKLTPHLGAMVETAEGLGKELRIGFRHLQAAWRLGVVLV